MMNPAPTFLVLGRQCGSLARLGHRKPYYRFSSSSAATAAGDLVLQTMDEDAGIAMLTMNRPPANSLSLEMNVALCSSIKSIEANPRIQSVILASSNPRIFSAGLDLAELVAPDADRLPRFWNSLQQVFVDLYGSRLATVAAIGGHAPAAGCFLALACDHRIMSAGDTGEGAPPPPAIGFNETRLGIAAPPWMGKMLVRTIGWRRAELALALGTLFPPDEALGIGLVDAVVPPRTSTSADEADDDAWLDLLPSAIRGRASDPALLRKAYAQASIYAKIPHQARVASKLVTREEHIHDMIAKRENDTDHFCEFVTQEAVQRILKGYVESMKKKGKKK